MGQYIDFNYIKANADIEAVLNALDISIVRQSGNELRIHCPNPDHEDNKASCDINNAEYGNFRF